MTTATTGSGTITLGSAVSGFLTFAGAGVQDGDTVSYGISDGSSSEVGRGVYTSSGTTLTRSVLRSTNSNSAISLSGTATVFITPLAEDVRPAAPTIVQSKITALTSTFSTTLTSVPTAGNILIAICNNLSGAQTASSGWTKVNNNTNGLDYTDVFVRVVNGDTTTINPTTGTSLSNVTISVWEIAGASIPLLNLAGSLSFCDTGFSGATTVNLKQWQLSSSNLLLFSFTSSNTTAPTLSNGTSSGTASGSSRSIQAGYFVGLNASSSVSVTYNTSSTGKSASIVMMPG